MIAALDTASDEELGPDTSTINEVAYILHA